MRNVVKLACEDKGVAGLFEIYVHVGVQRGSEGGSWASVAHMVCHLKIEEVVSFFCTEIF